tara:strand:+ start:253 stop:360 length:108 start_codon:yes stop_codon:yes gene_type:complete
VLLIGVVRARRGGARDEQFEEEEDRKKDGLTCELL